MKKFLFLLIGFCLAVLSLQSLASAKQVQRTSPNRKNAAGRLLGSKLRADIGKWEIREYDDLIVIQAGIFRQELVFFDSLFASAGLLVGRDNLISTPAEELSVTFMKAFPNQKPEGIGFSGKSGVEQTDAVENQTDALSVEKKETNGTGDIRWVDWLRVDQPVFLSVFKKMSCRISKPDSSTTRCTLIFSAVHPLEGIFAEVNYEIYSGYPVIRERVTFRNQGEEWIKISDFMLENWHQAANDMQTTMLMPDSRGVNPSVLAFSDSADSQGVIAVSKIPSRLRHLAPDGSIGRNY